MHKIKHVWEKITSLENIEEAIVRASEKKKKRRLVQRVLSNKRQYALQIQRMLIEKSFEPTPYIPVKVRDGASGKERLIHKPAFYPDQIIHWALVLPMQEQWKKSIYPLSCGSIPGRGLHKGARAMKRWMKDDHKGTKYCYKIDITKYYPSVDLDILYAMFERHVHDGDTLWLIRKIIYSHSPGLPIGNFTSQWFANLYLSHFDWWVKQELKVAHYVRYIDDIVVLHGNKRKLHAIRHEMENKLEEDLHLRIKRNWQVFKVDGRGVDFLGFRFFHDYTIIRKKTAYRISRKVREIGRKPYPSPSDASSAMSYLGVTNHCNSHHFMERYVLPFISIYNLKEAHRAACKALAG
jgi:retron-type reverse transcriptase